MSKKLPQHTEAGICPLTRQGCIGERCKFWQTFSTFESERTSLDLCEFLSRFMPVAEMTKQLNALLMLQHEMAELVEREELAGRCHAENLERYERCKSARILLCEKLEAEIKHLCLEQGFEFISCSFNADAAGADALGKVHYLGRGPDEGDCLLAVGALYAEIA